MNPDLDNYVYNLYIFNDGTALVSTKSINYFRDDAGAKLIGSKLTRAEAISMQHLLYSNTTLYMMIEKLVNETTSFASASENYVAELERKVEMLTNQKVDLQCKVELLRQKINAFKITSKF